MTLLVPVSYPAVELSLSDIQHDPLLRSLSLPGYNYIQSKSFHHLHAGEKFLDNVSDITSAAS